MTTDHVTAEDVIEAARAFCAGPSPDSWDPNQAESGARAIDQLRELIARYDAQKKGERQ